MALPRFALIGLVLACLASSAALARAQKPESDRLSDETFRKGLLDLKLFHLLDYDLKTYPPANKKTALLLRREMALAVHKDPLTDADKRARALATANQILAELIDRYPKDERAVDWRLDLAKSLIYDQAEPYYTSIFYRGGTKADRTQLAALMDETVRVLGKLGDFLKAEYSRIDDLSIAEYEQLDETGYVLKIEAAMPRTAYMLRWARFYRALAMDEHDPQRDAILADVLKQLTDETSLLTEDHAQTHVQAQSLLLAGLCSRRLANYDSAIRYLQDAAQVVAGIRDPHERHDLQWLIVLSTIERVRALRDAGEFDGATQVLTRLEARQRTGGEDNFGLELTYAMLEASIVRARATQARRSGDERRARTLEAQALDPLARLADRRPQNRDEIYAALYDQLRDAPNPDELQPFEKAAIIAGDLREATRLRQLDTNDSAAREQAERQAVDLLDEAIHLATDLLKDTSKIDNRMICEVHYNLGAAQYNRGLRFEAANSFVTVAEACQHMARASSAAAYAVEIAAELAQDPSLRDRDDVRQLHLKALRVLVEDYADTAAAEYWRFFLAQALEQQGDLDEAARVYSEVSQHQPNYLLARFRAVRCRVQSLSAYVAAHPDELPEITRLAGDARHAVERFKQTVAQRQAANVMADRDVPVESLLAESDVLLGEVDVLPGVDRPADALRTLGGFEQRFPKQNALMGRVLRVRIIAYEATGRLDQARLAVPQYVASAPAEAGRTLQALFESTSKDIEQYRHAGRNDLADRKAASALMFAEQIHDWATSGDQKLDADGLQLVRLQLAEANLEAKHPQQALQLFRKAVEFDAARDDGQAHDPRAVLGLADTLYALGNYAEALPLYNRMFRELGDDSRRHFAALLGDLRCRTELDEPPQPIIDVIRQHRYLNPDMGGDDLKQAFAELQQRNEQRLE